MFSATGLPRLLAFAVILGVSMLLPVAASAAPPSNTALPSVSGSANVGSTLSANSGTWANSPTSYAYQWQRCGYAATVTADNPVAFWRLNEASGSSFFDSSANANAGSYFSSPTLGAAGGLTGDSDTAVTLNGTSHYAKAPSASSLNSPTSALTLEALVKPSSSSITSQKPIVLKSYTSHNPPYYQYGLFLDYPATINFALGIGGNYQSLSVSNSGWVAGSWNHIAATYDGSTMRVYVNGVQKGSRSQSGSISTNATPVDIGAYENLGKNSSYLFGGSVDEVAIYSSALSATRLQAHSDTAFATSAGCTSIAGATSSSYTPVTADLGAKLRVNVTATNADGATTASSATSAAVGSPLPPSNTASPTASGTATAGEVLTAGDGTWDNGVTTFARQWRRCDASGASCANITGATNSSYTLVAGDIGSTIRVAITATNSAGSSTSSSSATSVVAHYPAPSIASQPTVVGYVNTNTVMKTNGGRFASKDSITRAYQWQRCDAATCSNLPGATAATYTASVNDLAYRLRVSVTASNQSGGSTTNAFSAKSPVDYETSVLASSPVAYWPLDESSGSVAADRTGNHDASYAVGYAGYSGAGAPVKSNNRASTPTGGFGEAAPYSAALNPRSFSVEAWVRLSAVPGDASFARIVSTCDPEGGSAVSGFRLEVNTPYHLTPRIAFMVRGASGGYHYIDAGSEVHTDKWYYVVGTFDDASNEIHLYVNGDELSGLDQGSLPLGFSPNTTNATVIGPCSGDPTPYASTPSPLNGNIDEVAIYDHVLTSDEIISRCCSFDGGSSGSHPPFNTEAPSITGLMNVGETLTAHDGTWNGGSSVTITRQWQRCDPTATPPSCTDITGATGTTYVPTTTDGGSVLRLAVTATNSYGNTTSYSPFTILVAQSIQTLAERYRPSLHFSSGEHYRPLEIESFLAEGVHERCDHAQGTGYEQDDCNVVSTLSALTATPSTTPESQYIAVWPDNGSPADDEAYRSQSCSSTDFLRDCGDKSAIYYYYNQSANGYRYLNYWWYYRYNPIAFDDHQGDWEGVTVVLATNNAIQAPNEPIAPAGVVYAAHGYLMYRAASGLQWCDASAQNAASICSTVETPGSGTATHPAVFVASGTHASYDDQCSGTTLDPCPNPAHPSLPEQDHEGSSPWLENSDTACSAVTGGGCVRRMLPTDAWVKWEGLWGTEAYGTAGPQSPGQQTPFECTEDEWHCSIGQGTVPYDRKAPVRNERPTHTRDVAFENCTGLNDLNVAAFVCGATTGKRPVAVAGRTTAKTASFAEVTGGPLVRGSRFVINSGVHVGQNVDLHVRDDKAIHSFRLRKLSGGQVQGSIVMAHGRPAVVITRGSALVQER